MSRGPALIFTAFCLIAAPVAMQFFSDAQAEADASAHVETGSEQQAACDNGAVDTATGQSSCQNDALPRQTRRQDSTGALFISVGGN